MTNVQRCSLSLFLLGGGSLFAAGPPGPCSLLTKSEVQRVQGAVVVQMKESAPPRKGIAVSQCFYDAETFEKSVSLEVTRPAAKPARDDGPRQRWAKLFHSPEASAPSRGQNKGNGKAGKAEDAGRPQPVHGVGDEAFWMSDRVAGALFVRKGHVYFRISVGGWPDEAVRLDKTKALARNVAKRL